MNAVFGSSICLLALELIEQAELTLVYHGGSIRPLIDKNKVITFNDFNTATSREFLGWKHEDLIALYEEWQLPEFILFNGFFIGPRIRNP
jgi:hypothetical protein